MGGVLHGCATRRRVFELTARRRTRRPDRWRGRTAWIRRRWPSSGSARPRRTRRWGRAGATPCFPGASGPSPARSAPCSRSPTPARRSRTGLAAVAGRPPSTLATRPTGSARPTGSRARSLGRTTRGRTAQPSAFSRSRTRVCSVTRAARWRMPQRSAGTEWHAVCVGRPTQVTAAPARGRFPRTVPPPSADSADSRALCRPESALRRLPEEGNGC
jgi:hypothetical protein